jgi:N-acetylneuraminic acid mutarotase
MFLFGGCWGTRWERRSPANFDDIVELNLRTQLWTRIEVPGPIPNGVSHHSAVVHGNTVVIFGGKSDAKIQNQIFVYDFELRRWNTPKVDGQIPPRRYRHTCVIQDQIIYLFGGKEENSYFNDTYTLDLHAISLIVFTSLWLINGEIDYHQQGLPASLVSWLDWLCDWPAL